MHQDNRNYRHVSTADLKSFIEDMQAVASVTGLTIDQVLKAREICESERKNTLYVTNGDIHDEQMAGIGELLEKISYAIQAIADSNQSES